VPGVLPRIAKLALKLPQFAKIREISIAEAA